MKNQGNWFGRVYADVIRNKDIPATAKAIYAYLAVLCGSADECFPSVQTITEELNISRDTFYRQMKPLISLGIVKKRQSIDNHGRFGSCVYSLPDRPCIDNTDTVKTVDGENRQTVSEISDRPCTENQDTKEKHIKEKQVKRNYREIADLYNQICVSFPRVQKLSENRKKTINARFNDGYTVDDFRKMFEMAEGSKFLKGQNDRGWSASFDWMIKESNMEKIIEGNYSDRGKPKTSVQAHEPAMSFYDQYMKGE